MHLFLRLAKATEPPHQTYWRDIDWVDFAEETTQILVSGELLTDDQLENLLSLSLKNPDQAISEYPTLAKSNTWDQLKEETAILLLLLVEQLQKGTISFQRWQEQHARIMIAAHLKGLSVGLKKTLSAVSLDRVSKIFREHLYSNIRTNGKQFGLSVLSKDLLSGQLSLSQLKQRSLNYGATAFISFQLGVQIARDTPTDWR